MKGYQNIKDIKNDLKKKGKPILMVEDAKQVKFAGFKQSPSKPTAEQLILINRITRKDFTADQMYIGQLRLANNCIDRDKERFSEDTITRYTATAIRKTMLLDHDKKVRDSAIGKFFDVELEKMPLQQAIAETGENLILPDGMSEVWFCSPWFYIPVEAVDPREIIKIDASIYDWASIGFRCESLVPIMDKDGKILFWEYRGNGIETEMTEGSLVYLGAQYGMAVKGLELDNPQSAIRNPKLNDIPGEGKEAGNVPANPNEGGQSMKELLAKLKALYGKTFSEDGLFDELKTFVDEKAAAAVAAAVAPLNIKIAELAPLTAKVAELTPLAEDGKTYRDGLVKTYVTQKAKLEECAETPEAQDALKKVVAAYPVDFLKSEVAHLEKRVAEKFPAEAQLASDGDPEKRDKSKGAAAAGKKHPLDPNK